MDSTVDPKPKRRLWLLLWMSVVVIVTAVGVHAWMRDPPPTLLPPSRADMWREFAARAMTRWLASRAAQVPPERHDASVSESEERQHLVARRARVFEALDGLPAASSDTAQQLLAVFDPHAQTPDELAERLPLSLCWPFLASNTSTAPDVVDVALQLRDASVVPRLPVGVVSDVCTGTWLWSRSAVAPSANLAADAYVEFALRQVREIDPPDDAPAWLLRHWAQAYVVDAPLSHTFCVLAAVCSALLPATPPPASCEELAATLRSSDLRVAPPVLARKPPSWRALAAVCGVCWPWVVGP